MYNVLMRRPSRFSVLVAALSIFLLPLHVVMPGIRVARSSWLCLSVEVSQQSVARDRRAVVIGGSFRPRVVAWPSHHTFLDSNWQSDFHLGVTPPPRALRFFSFSSFVHTRTALFCIQATVGRTGSFAYFSRC
ncbi:hypothetical protein BC827DRAFT_435022 [Russula dissimulans]|nr:hypothetical protein BC827DRAFT_435022 [Russula dissimulans]